MRGVGGPLLCISDLLSDVREENSGASQDHAPPRDVADASNMPASDLPKLFQENFEELKGALEGADHSWTALTLKLCSALETANKLVDSANSQVASLSEKVEEVEQIVQRRDSAITAAKTIQGLP
ncbi:TNF receptor-associated factor 6 [Striga asiatica]|uniref:TNF receptor-associated factor 6 n=1 Tax=Striga asiatica TaxID=4170 RepID=A0A5A7QW71_STRAF|nr:TNF receptor-associated factor 6 [Striga asiatica]